MNDNRPVLVIGGTRGTGLLIARRLHQRGVPVRVLARDRTRALTLFDRSVEVVSGDLTKPDTLPVAMAGTRDVIFTAGCRSGHPVREPAIKAVEYHGVIHALEAARRCDSPGRRGLRRRAGSSEDRADDIRDRVGVGRAALAVR